MTSQENTIVDKADNVKQPESTPVDTPEQEVQEQNWKKFRERREEERKAREHAEKVAAEERAKAEALKQAMEALLNKQPNNYHEQSETQEENEDDRINKKVEAALEARIRIEENKRAQQEKANLPQKLNSSLPEFERICSANNLDYLEYHYPEVTAGFKHLPDTYDKWENIYKAVKRFVPNVNHEKDNKKMEANLKKPQGMQTSTLEGTTGTKGPNFLSEERRAENWARMQRTINKLD